MKKTIIAALSALAILTPNAMRADEPAKEYNMVITLQNGTTITLGHNDIKNITFNGEEISISGNAANTIEDLGNQTLENRARITDIYASLDYLRALIDDEDNQMKGEIASLNGKVDMLMNYINDLQGRNLANEASITSLNAVVSDMENRNENMEGQIQYLQAHINNLYYMIEELQRKVNE